MAKFPPLPPGSHAWCSEPDCEWTDLTPEAEAKAHAHSESRQHLVHVYIKDGL